MKDLLRCRAALHEDCLVIRPAGTLDVATYPDLRDRLLKHAVEQPRALVVDLTDLVVELESLLSVFATVWLRTRDWPAVPLLLVASPDQVPNPKALRRYATVHGTVEAAIASVGAQPLRRRTDRWMPCDVVSPIAARTFVRETCLLWGLPADLTTDAAVVATELVTNAVEHARSAARLRLELRRDLLTIAVSDDDPTPATLRDTAWGEHLPGGYGLLLVSRLAATWGCVPDPENHRKVVWAVLTTRR